MPLSPAHTSSTLCAPGGEDAFLDALLNGTLTGAIDPQALEDVDLLAQRAHHALVRWAMPVFPKGGMAGLMDLPAGAHPCRVGHLMLELGVRQALPGWEVADSWCAFMDQSAIGVTAHSRGRTGRDQIMLMLRSLPPAWVFRRGALVPRVGNLGINGVATRLRTGMEQAARVYLEHHVATDGCPVPTLEWAQGTARDIVLSTFRLHGLEGPGHWKSGSGASHPLPQITADDMVMLSTYPDARMRVLERVLEGHVLRSGGTVDGRVSPDSGGPRRSGRTR